jgi:hypothetical protein
MDERALAIDARANEETATSTAGAKRPKPAKRPRAAKGIAPWQPLDPASITEEQKKAAHELIRHGDLSWLLHPGQIRMREFIRKQLYVENKPHVVCNVSRQSGKSWGMVCEAFEWCLIHPGTVTWYLAPYGAQVERIVALSIERILAFFPPDCMPTKRGKTWRFPNGARFDLIGVNVGRGARIRGTPASLAIIDECRDIPHLQSVIDSSINPSFTTTRGKLILISTPADSPLHPFTSKYIAEAIYSESYFHATFRDNPLLRLTDDDLRQMYPRLEEDPVYRREMLADWSIADTSRRIIKSWDAEANDAWMAEYGNRDKLHMFSAYTGLDPGFSTDALGLVFGYFDWRYGVLVIEDEWSAHQMTTAALADKIHEMETALGYRQKERCPRIHRISDIAKRIIADLQMSFGLDFEPVNKLGMTKPAMVSLLDDELKSRIRVAPKCIKLRQQIEAGIWAEGGKDYFRTEAHSHLDLLDAARYLAMSCSWHESYKNIDHTKPYDRRSDTIFMPPRNQRRGGTWLDALRR